MSIVEAIHELPLRKKLVFVNNLVEVTYDFIALFEFKAQLIGKYPSIVQRGKLAKQDVKNL